MIFKKRNINKRSQEFDGFWIQKVQFERHPNRVEFFKSICLDKNTLHFGCTDFPIFDPENNLHIELSKTIDNLDGFDIDLEGIELLKNYCPGNYYTEFSHIKKSYDVCLVPETIEHVDNVATFLGKISTVNSQKFVFTAPNCFSKEIISRNLEHEDEFIEIVHPDHNCWYSPYTLKNVIEKYSSLKVIDIFLLESDRMIACVAVPVL